MKLDPATTKTEIEALLKSHSEMVYGPDRTQEIAGQIEHLSAMLEEIARHELDLRDAPPDTRGIVDRSGR